MTIAFPTTGNGAELVVSLTDSSVLFFDYPHRNYT
jgi:hypothetical protein